jgi:hypothetical protein
VKAERHCSWCQAEGKPSFLGYTETCDGNPTHGMCQRHYEQMMIEAGLSGEPVVRVEERSATEYPEESHGA